MLRLIDTIHLFFTRRGSRARGRLAYRVLLDLACFDGDRLGEAAPPRGVSPRESRRP